MSGAMFPVTHFRGEHRQQFTCIVGRATDAGHCVRQRPHFIAQVRWLCYAS